MFDVYLCISGIDVGHVFVCYWYRLWFCICVLGVSMSVMYLCVSGIDCGCVFVC
jgi:hypothetical protein